MAGVNTAQGFEAMSSVGLRPFSAHTTSSYNPSLHRRKSSQGQQAAAQMALQESTEDRGSDSTTALHGATEHHGQFEPSALALLVGGYHTSTQRPLDPAVSTLIEAAHHKHATRKLAHPVVSTSHLRPTALFEHYAVESEPCNVRFECRPTHTPCSIGVLKKQQKAQGAAEHRCKWCKLCANLPILLYCVCVHAQAHILAEPGQHAQ